MDPVSSNNLRLVDSFGVAVERVFLTTNVEMKYHFEADVPISSVSVEKELPEGLALSNEGELSGKPLNPMNRTVYVFSANGGSLTASIQLSVIDCSYGPVVVIGANACIHVTINQDGKRIVDDTISKENAYCLKEGTYTYEVTSTFFDYVGLYIRSGELMIHSRFDYPSFSDSFHIGVTSSPQIKLPAVIPVQQKGLQLPFQIEGSYNKVVVEPVEGIVYNPVTNVFSFQYEEDGLYEHTIVASNPVGSIAVNFTVAVNQCPEDRKKIIIDTYYHFFTTFNLYDEQKALLLHRYKTVQTPYFFCAKPDTEYPYKLNQNKMFDESLLFSFNDEHGPLVEVPLNGLVESTFIYHQIAPFGTEFKYYKDIDKDWAKKDYDDSFWSKAKTGNWGKWEEGNDVYFRYSFTIDDFHFSTLQILLHTNISYSVYVNEKMVSRLADSYVATTHRIPVPFSFLENKNVIAIDLHKDPFTPAPPINFDMELIATKSTHINLSVNGEVKEEQDSPDPQHKAESAFKNDIDYWKISSFPASAEYTFACNRSQIVNSVFYAGQRNLIRSFRVEGIDNGHHMELFKYSSKNIHAKSYFDFSNTVPYVAYRVVIEEAQQMSELDIYSFRLLQNNPQVCESKWGIEGAKVGSVFLRECPNDEVGKEQVKCVSNDFVPVWVEDTSSCLPLYPPTDKVFIDFTLNMTSAKELSNEFYRDTLPDALVGMLKIEKNEVSYAYVYTQENDDVFSIQTAIRFTIDDDLGDHVEKVFLRQKQAFIDKMMSEQNVEIVFDKDPVIHRKEQARFY